MGFGSGVLTMDRYVIVDTDGFAENTIIWDGTTALTLPAGYTIVREDNSSVKEKPVYHGSVDSDA